MAATKTTTVRFTPGDLALIDAMQAHTGIVSSSDLLRLALRALAKAEGVKVPKAEPARKPGRPRAA